MFESNLANIAIELLQADDSIQQRVNHTDQETVDRYAEAAAGGWPFPPIVVFRDPNGKHWLADGFHRVEVADQLGIDQVPAEIRLGSQRDAVLFAVGANDQHGLPRSNADKRRAVTTMLNDAEWSAWSDREIATQCQVSHPFVAKVREQFEEGLEQIKNLTGNVSSQINKHPSPAVRKTANGRTINTANISKANKERARKPPPTVTPAKAAQQALHRFGGACADLRSVKLERPEMFRVAECLVCGSRFKRGVAERWKRLCISCYAYNKAAQAHDAQTRWLWLVR
ncbi:MAG: ParB/RepB/Spo0J family partition protein [Chromatiaceae bacterium]|nr:ParB/RepB/Spo0J family partition protein [Chromatiaceae bacterium]